MKNNLEWKCIYYHEELDTDGTVINIEWTDEAVYRNGYLVKHTLQQCDIITNESITFCTRN